MDSLNDIKIHLVTRKHTDLLPFVGDLDYLLDMLDYGKLESICLFFPAELFTSSTG